MPAWRSSPRQGATKKSRTHARRSCPIPIHDAGNLSATSSPQKRNHARGAQGLAAYPHPLGSTRAHLHASHPHHSFRHLLTHQCSTSLAIARHDATPHAQRHRIDASLFENRSNFSHRNNGLQALRLPSEASPAMLSTFHGNRSSQELMPHRNPLFARAKSS